MALSIDINADVGESCGEDAVLMPWITSASIAAGFHAGDPSILRATIALANAHAVAVGVHPGFPDRDGFGRREMHLAPSELEDLLLYQIAAVAGVAAAEATRVQHVKPHGALYNMAVRDEAIATVIARAIRAFDKSLVLFAPSHSRLFAAGRAAGLGVAAEIFADRAYQPDGSLVSRSDPAAVVKDPDVVISRAIRMIMDESVIAIDGTVVPLEADTICVHGDTPGAGVLARRLREGLEAAGIIVRTRREL